MNLSNLAVIILNYNCFEKSYECLQSLWSIYDGKLTIYFIDNASKDGSGDRIYKLFPSIKYYKLSENCGYAAGNNFGLKKAYNDNFKYFLILNNDIVVYNDFVIPLLEEMKRDSKIGMVTCKILYKDNPDVINSAGGIYSKIKCAGVNDKIGKIDDKKVEKKYINFIPGMLVLLKREVIEKTGYMKEHFFMYFEDLEYSIRVNKNFRLLYTSEVSVLHHSGGGLKGKSYSSLYLYYHTRNRLWFFKQINFLLFIYAVFFTFFNALIKTVIVIIENKREWNSKRTLLKKIRNLWLGYLHGIIKRPQVFILHKKLID